MDLQWRTVSGMWDGVNMSTCPLVVPKESFGMAY